MSFIIDCKVFVLIVDVGLEFDVVNLVVLVIAASRVDALIIHVLVEDIKLDVVVEVVL